MEASLTPRRLHRYPTGIVFASCAGIFLLGLFVRLAFVTLRPGLGTEEPVNIAVSIAATGRYADAYGPGVGPTAHAAPLHPLMLSALLKLFGTGIGGVRAISVLASTESSLAFALLPALAVASGFGLGCGVLAGLGGALLPVNFWHQTNGSFEAPLTALLLVTLCILLSRTWAARSFTISQAAIFGFVAGAACLTSPVVIPVLVAWSVASVLRFRDDFQRVIVFFAVAAGLVLVMLAPWAVRNHRALGAFIWTRSDFGIELQVSNNDLMTADLERNVALPEFALFHPHVGEHERARVKAMGEVAYSNAKLHEALAWIASHPDRFASLTAQRIRLFWMPRMVRWWQTVLEAALSFGALIGLALLFWRRSDSAWILGAAVVMYPPVYYLIQAAPRYRLPLESILYLLAARALTFLFERKVPRLDRAVSSGSAQH